MMIIFGCNVKPTYWSISCSIGTIMAFIRWKHKNKICAEPNLRNRSRWYQNPSVCKAPLKKLVTWWRRDACHCVEWWYMIFAERGRDIDAPCGRLDVSCRRGSPIDSACACMMRCDWSSESIWFSDYNATRFVTCKDGSLQHSSNARLQSLPPVNEMQHRSTVPQYYHCCRWKNHRSFVPIGLW